MSPADRGVVAPASGPPAWRALSVFVLLVGDRAPGFSVPLAPWCSCVLGDCDCVVSPETPRLPPSSCALNLGLAALSCCWPPSKLRPLAVSPCWQGGIWGARGFFDSASAASCAAAAGGSQVSMFAPCLLYRDADGGLSRYSCHVLRASAMFRTESRLASTPCHVDHEPVCALIFAANCVIRARSFVTLTW